MFDNTVGEKVMQLRSGEVLGVTNGEVLGEDWEEVNACEYERHGTVAAEVSAASLAGACLSQPKALMRVDRGHSDPRYEPSADRIPGQPEPASLLYLDLSDPGDPDENGEACYDELYPLSKFACGFCGEPPPPAP